MGESSNEGVETTLNPTEPRIDHEVNENEVKDNGTMLQSKVGPRVDVKTLLEQGIRCMLRSEEGRANQRHWNDPETEVTVFRRFCCQFLDKLGRLKQTELDALEAVTCSTKQTELLGRMCGLEAMYCNMFGGAVMMEDFVIQELSKLRCRVLDAETRVRALAAPQHFPGHTHHHMNAPPNPGMLRGAAAGQYMQEQKELNFMCHAFREGEPFALKSHENHHSRISSMAEQDPLSESNQPVQPFVPDKEAANVSVSDPNAYRLEYVAHQFKTMLFSYKLLAEVGVELNVYNMWMFFPTESNLLDTAACFLLQVCAPIFVLIHSVDASDLRMSSLNPMDYIVIFLFGIINWRIFTKQTRNTLVSQRLRNVVWNADSHPRWHPNESCDASINLC